MPLPAITAIGNLTGDPELRFTPTGAAVVNFRIACNDRRKNQSTGEWEDGDTTFLDVSAWRDQAENTTASLKKGDAVIVTGHLKTSTYDKRAGGTATRVELIADTIGASLARATATLQRANKAPAGTFSAQTQNEWDGPAPF